jgi:hypothetical protein
VTCSLRGRAPNGRLDSLTAEKHMQQKGKFYRYLSNKEPPLQQTMVTAKESTPSAAAVSFFIPRCRDPSACSPARPLLSLAGGIGF